MSLKPDILIEYEATVTQLAATSEVATIGFLLTVPGGERIKPLAGMLVVSAQGGNETGQIQILNTNASKIAEVRSTTLNNKTLSIFDANFSSDIDGAGNEIGINQEIELGSGMAIKAVVSSTLDAATTLIFRFLYKSRYGKLTATAVGAGISITSETHQAI